MINKNKWIYSYNNLNPDSQLEVAEVIANELKDNEITFNENEYDKEKSKLMRVFFNSIINNAKHQEELKKFADIFEKFESLSQNNKRKVINETLEIVVRYILMQEQENKKESCEHEKHIFNEWSHNKWTEYIDTVIDHQYVHNLTVEHENWQRICSRCGFIETVEHEPQELIDARKEKNTKLRIKKLESELKKLKSE